MKTALFALFTASLCAQPRLEPGHSIGKVTTQGNLVVMELDDAALGHTNMFDLAGRTLKFTREGAAYRIENADLQWDTNFGAELTGASAPLQNFAFPFSGKNWDSLSVGLTGSIAFAAAPLTPPAGGRGGRGGRGGGVTVDRFAQLQEAARTLVNGTPALCVFFKPRMNGTRYFKELDDRAVITWDLSEPFAGIQDFTWTKTVNQFQAVLHKDGAIEMSYKQLAARDAIVGIYPQVNAANERALATIPGPKDSGLPPHLEITNVKLSAVGGVFLKAAIETKGAIVPEGDSGLVGIAYRVVFDTHPQPTVWTIRGVGPGNRGGGGRSGGGGYRYFASGPGVSGGVTVNGNTIAVQGMLPESLKGLDQVAVSADVLTSATAAELTGKVAPRPVKLAGIHSAVDFSAVKRSDGPFTVAYESFHYLSLPNPRDLTCTVIQALGDKFDFLAYYSDFRVDNQEAGTPSNGPLGGGPGGGAVSGIGAQQRGLDSYCTQGRFQWQFIQPVYVGSNQMQERPPEGHTNDNTHNVGYYDRQLGERWPDQHMPPYNYALSQIGHEMGHRWSAFVSAKVNGETIPLGPTHWAMGLQAPVPFPYQRPTEASAMGGGVWQDNFDGTFTQLDDDYYVPATGWSYLDLYLMGLITAQEVPDFFILRNIQPQGRDANGHLIVKADRAKVTIEDVMAVEGPRLPGVDQSQKKFNTGIVVITEHGQKPSKELLDRAEAIRLRWVDYWETTTGHRSSMTATPK
ncbi:MAG TPA: hypothetical protein VKE70_21085 [Candidatus Solibacter sp.]|nr:hypothetical protein [Candidatus Solibacter sp.]